MDKYEKLEKKLNISKETEIFIPVYSEDMFVELKVGNKDEFYNLSCVEDIAFTYFDKLYNTSLDTITFGVIDENYLSYLKDNNLEDSNFIRQKYIKEMSIEERKKYWKKNDYNYGYDFGILPLIFENSEYKDVENTADANYNFKLSEENIKKIRKSICDTFNQFKEKGTEYHLLEKNIFISPYILNLELYNNESVIDKLFDYGVCMLNNDYVSILKEFETQTIDATEPLDFFGILIMYRYEVPPSITKEYIKIAQGSPVNAPDVDIDLIDEVLQTDIDIKFELLTSNLIYPETIDDVIKEFIEVVVHQAIQKIQAEETLTNDIANHCKKTKKKKKK